ncbi:MAG: NAD(P)H-dependent glycerol-3-phosphate dehydrogenase [candidate division WOR-3 bacterium]
MKIVVVGAGSWGTAFSIYLSRIFPEVFLFVRRRDVLELIKDRKENPIYLPGVPLPDNLFLVGEKDKIEDFDIIVNAIPVQFIRNFYSGLTLKGLIVNLSKGIEIKSKMRVSEIFKQLFPDAEYCVISGPSFALEVAMGKPTACVVSSENKEIGIRVQRLFSSTFFRLYYNPDMVGVELGGSLKNVIAIACGICDGLGLGYNARASLLNRGLIEMARFGKFMGANVSTFFGLSGLGDLVLTATGDLSRNRRFGISIGSGVSVDEALSGRGVVEGVWTARAVYEIAREFGIEMPITEEVYRVVFESKDPKESIEKLMRRELKVEFDF